MKSLGDRMKHNYENVSRYHLTRRTPVIIRLDGKSFHTLTKRCMKPFDIHFIECMHIAAQETVKEIQGCKAAYVQSDEVSLLLTDYDELNTQGWFDYNLQKIVSISASLMSTWFNHFSRQRAVFDSRAFNIPKEEVANYFLWRMQDWHRNSIQMYAQAFFSHQQLMNKNLLDIHEMLYQKGENWATDLSDQIKNGTWIIGDEVYTSIRPLYSEISNKVDPLISGAEVDGA